MKKKFDKLKETAKILGFDLEFFPGIPVAVLVSYFVLVDNKHTLIKTLGLNINSEVGQQSIVLISAIIIGVFLWVISGTILNPLSDKFSPGNRKRISELKTRRREAREKMIKLDESYQDPSKPIYPKIKKMLKESKLKYFLNIFNQQLTVSKFFRLLVLPVLILAIAKLFISEIVIGFVFLILSIGFLHISFLFRDNQMITLYTWFTEHSGAKSIH